MSRKRALLFNTDLERGGVPGVVRELAVRLRARGHDVSVACLGGLGPVGEELADAGVPVQALGARSPLDLRVLGALRQHVQQRGFDVVLSSLVHANVVAAWSARSMPEVRWLQAIHTTQPRPRWHWMLQAWAAQHAERIVAPSASIAECAITRSRVAREKLRIIPNGIDIGRFSGISPAPVAGLPVPIGFVGRLDPVKRLPDLLEAVRLLRGRVCLHVFGEGEDRGRLEGIIRRSHLQEQVKLHGTITSPEAALSQVAILALCSEAEGLPMVLLEAQAAGVPIVATDAPGIRDAVEGGETALLAPVGDAHAIAEAIWRVLESPPLRRRLGEAGRQRAREHFDWQQILPLYETLLFA